MTKHEGAIYYIDQKFDQKLLADFVNSIGGSWSEFYPAGFITRGSQQVTIEMVDNIQNCDEEDGYQEFKAKFGIPPKSAFLLQYKPKSKALAIGLTRTLDRHFNGVADFD